MAKIPLHHILQMITGPLGSKENVEKAIKRLEQLPPDQEINLLKFAEGANKKEPQEEIDADPETPRIKAMIAALDKIPDRPLHPDYKAKNKTK